MTSGQLRLKLIAPWHQPALDSPHGVSSRRIEKALHLIGSFVSEWTRIVRRRRQDDRDESQPATRIFFVCLHLPPTTTTNRRSDVAGLTDSQSDYVPLAAPRERPASPSLGFPAVSIGGSNANNHSARADCSPAAGSFLWH